ncbi:hypothetical protein ABL78_2851 [Leptomonas seymouri]|uniref:Uncharacterized protein n=1 Tax=Leptomonas seymouri TaxID=5684 RepID=A0A0N1PD80_LEPSE|nr:hypothetical protein ABL78_2851 [Leptomonas seymouri]|eukprot:KPI88075.1 hypothetical protein ABL78_2851 [Leptomonas seymouri]
MFVIPVEKKGKYAHSLSLRFLCYDPATRMAYLSDKDSKIRQWKHRMKVYAVMPACTQGGDSINFRLWNYEAKTLLSFTVSGVTYHRLNSSNPADQIELQRLPVLLNMSYQDSAPSIRASTEGGGMQRPSQEPVSLTDDLNVFGKDRDDWSLRCPYYNAAHDMIMLMRDALIADGLRFPIYGGLLSGVDPRNGLHLAEFPLYLQQNFRQLVGAIVYSCVHGKMIGCDPQGHLGPCMRHAYLCVTDQDVLFVAESGCVARSVPLSVLHKVEFSGSVTPLSNPASDRSSPTRSHPVGLTSTPFIAFLSDGESADVLFSPCSAFPAESEDCSASMAASMPRMDVGREVNAILHVLTTLLRKHGEKTVSTTSSASSLSQRLKKEHHKGFDAEVHLEGSVGSIDFDTPGLPAPSSLAVPLPAAAAAEAPADPAPLPSGFCVEALSCYETLQAYAEAFEARHGRAFKWQPLPTERHHTPTVQSAASVAQSLGMRRPQRQAIARRAEFLPFYYGSVAAAHAAEEQVRAMREARQAHASNANSHSDHSGYGDEMYAPKMPVRRVSKLVDMFKPELNIY